ncbi:MAG: sigma-70 family RNA polymerase sigma factor [Acidobacteria bacterium]|nr:sigma-70 family RNA polymerase sigma factor [Acidobacteriota bacterium]
MPCGRQEAFGEIYSEFAPLVHGILLSRLPRDEVSDAVQEVFLAAYKNLGSLREPNALGGWLARIARNHVVDHYRGSRPSEELPEHIEGKKDQRLEAEEALAAIQSLPIAYRETLILRLVEGMTGNEIAEQTGLSPDSVRVNLHRGMNLLRKKLGIGGENDE